MKNLKLSAGIFLSALVVGLVMVGPVAAKEATPPGRLQKEIRQDIKEEFKETVSSKAGALKDLANKLRGRAAIGSGTLTAISGITVPATLTIQGKDGKTYLVNISPETQLRRRFWGKATLGEFTLGDGVNVIGQWTDDAHTAINAKLVRDISIQKRFGVFIGDIKLGTLTTSGWTMTTASRGDQKVTVSTTTKFVNRKGQVMTEADLKEGNRVRVRGMWDRKANTITEVTEVKDYSIPVKTGPELKASGSATTAE